MDSKIDDIKQRASIAKSDMSASATSAKETLNEQIVQINQKVSELNQQKMDD